MMDSDLDMTCSLPSPLIGHQLAYMSVKFSHDFYVLQIMYRTSSQLVQPLQLSIIFHNHCSLSPRKFACLHLYYEFLLDHFFPVIDKL